MATNQSTSSNRGNQDDNNNSNGVNSGRGFAGMDPERQREIASEGGRAAHASGNAHSPLKRSAEQAR